MRPDAIGPGDSGSEAVRLRGGEGGGEGGGARRPDLIPAIRSEPGLEWWIAARGMVLLPFRSGQRGGR